MKKILPLLVFLSLLLSAQAQVQSAHDLMKKIDVLNDKCRGGSGDNPATEQACDQRDALYGKLEKMGWCWGHDGQSEYQKKWERCPAKKEEKPEIVSLYLPANGKEGKTYSLNIISLVIYPERRCNQTGILGYERMAYATMSRTPQCAAIVDNEVFVFGQFNQPSTYPKEYFALAQVDSTTNTAKVIQPGFDSEKMHDRLMQRQRKAIQQSLPGATPPPRDAR